MTRRLGKSSVVRPAGRFARRPRVEDLEDRLCLTGSLTLSLSDLTGTGRQPLRSDGRRFGRQRGRLVPVHTPRAPGRPRADDPLDDRRLAARPVAWPDDR